MVTFITDSGVLFPQGSNKASSWSLKEEKTYLADSALGIIQGHLTLKIRVADELSVGCLGKHTCGRRGGWTCASLPENGSLNCKPTSEVRHIYTAPPNITIYVRRSKIMGQSVSRLVRQSEQLQVCSKPVVKIKVVLGGKKEKHGNRLKSTTKWCVSF